MQIYYLFPNFFFIGAQRAAAATIRELVSRGWSISVVVFNNTGDMQNELPEGVDVIKLPLIPILSSIPLIRIFGWPLALRKLFKHKRPKYCISICPQTNFTMVLYRMLFGRDVIFFGEEHQHLTNAINNDPDDFKGFWKYLYQFSLKNYHRLDVLRCVSVASTDDFVRNWRIPANMVRTIYPAFDLDRIRSRSHGVSRNNPVPVICSVGRLTSQKDFSLLICAFAHIAHRTPAVLKIAGTGPEQGALTKLINELDLQARVTLLGFVEYAEELVASSDVFVMTSIWEGFPATLVESMVLGTPVVSVNCESGPAELIENGVTGLLVNNRDPAHIGQAIIDVLENPKLSKDMTAQAQERVKKFSLSATVTELETVLMSLH